MYINLAIIHIALGREAEFEDMAKNSNDSPLFQAPGFLSSTTLKDNDNTGRYFYTSVWRRVEDLLAFRSSQDYSKIVSGMSQSGLYVGPRDQVSAEVVFRRGQDFFWP